MGSKSKLHPMRRYAFSPLTVMLALLRMFGVSGVCNVLGAIKAAR